MFYVKKDPVKNDESIRSKSSASKRLPRGRGMLRADWGESSKVIAKDSDDNLVLGEFPNLDDQFLEW